MRPGVAGPFEAHLREAIALNRARAPLYAARTAGRSHAVSRRLIASEYLLLPVARWFDARAARYHAAEVPLLDALFVSMAEAPPYGATTPSTLPEAYAPPRPVRVRTEVVQGYRANGYAGAAVCVQRALENVNAYPHVDGMMRHLLESLRRLCSVAPRAVAAARAREMASPGWLLGLLFWGHLAALGFAARLDARARPLQCEGVPIVCHDVPHIPAWP